MSNKKKCSKPTNVWVVSKDGKQLMSTQRNGRVRHLLEEGKAKIYKYHPFTIQLLYDVEEKNQPMEASLDAGYKYIGLSVKTAKKEVLSDCFKLNDDEKENHDDRRKHRRDRRSQLRYRPPRFDNRVKPEGWLPPSILNKINIHIKLIADLCKVAPLTAVNIECGSFNIALMNAIANDETVDYKHGPRFGGKSIREAVFEQYDYTCQICGRSPKDDLSVKLVAHHTLAHKGRHGYSVREMVPVCTECHNQANHQEGGALRDIKPKKFNDSRASAFMVIAKSYLIRGILAVVPPGVKVNVCSGKDTHDKREALGIAKSHANDAYCIGEFLPHDRAVPTRYFEKNRRNNRVLVTRFEDAKYIDSRDGKEKPGKKLSSGRTKRSMPRSTNNQRIFRQEKVKKGKICKRTQRYPIQPHDILIYEGRKVESKGMQNRGDCVKIRELKDRSQEKVVSAKKVTIYKRAGAWIENKEVIIDGQKW